MSLTEVKEEVRQILAAAAGSPMCEIQGHSTLVDMWNRNKAWMAKYFGEDYRLRSKIELTDVALSNYSSAYHDTLYLMGRKLAQGVKYQGIVLDLGDAAVRFVRSAITPFTKEEVITNSIQRPVAYPGRDRMLPVGSKVSKYIGLLVDATEELCPSVSLLKGYFSKCADAEERKMVRDFVVTLYSQTFPALSCSGEVILSINPIDLLLSSAHTSGGWRSCHNLYDGEYRTGPVSYTCDSASAVAYVTYVTDTVADTTVQAPRKFWRQMVYFDKRMRGAVHSRQYPTENASYEQCVRSLTEDVLSRMNEGTVEKFTVSFFRQAQHVLNPNENECFKPFWSDVVFIDEGGWFYRDDPSLAINAKPEKVTVEPGGDIPCVICGERRDGDSWYDGREDRLHCSSCRDRHIFCERCGDELDEDDIYQGPDEEGHYCEDCFRELFAECHMCGELFERESLTETADSGLVCTSCLTRFERCHLCEEWVRDFGHVDAGDGENVVVCDECIDEGRDNGELVVCEECDCLVLKDAAIRYDGCWYCSDCGAARKLVSFTDKVTA
jgi:hypothetical protein